MRRGSYGIIALLSVGVAVYALVAYSLFPPGAMVHPDIRANFESHRVGICCHVFGASCSARAARVGPRRPGRPGSDHANHLTQKAVSLFLRG